MNPKGNPQSNRDAVERMVTAVRNHFRFRASELTDGERKEIGNALSVYNLMRELRRRGKATGNEMREAITRVRRAASDLGIYGKHIA